MTKEEFIKFRKKYFASQADAAGSMGVTTRTVYRYEDGTRNPHDIVRSWCDLYVENLMLKKKLKKLEKHVDTA